MKIEQLTTVLIVLLTGYTNQLKAQTEQHVPYISKAWVADQGNGQYKNPILNADYSDPDVIRVDDDFYMTTSSFDAIPGLPILHSKDLVNWKIIGHALKRQQPFDHFSQTQHGNGVWAPSIRFHEGEFYIYYGDPDFGIYMIKTKDPATDWEAPVLVEAGKGMIDVCPLWDDDGQAYIAYAYAGSRAGIKSVIAVKKLSSDGRKTLDEGVIVYDGHEMDPTIEGPKFYKRNGFYYIMAPAGGVSTGWQLTLRSKNIYGPYERHVSMKQGDTPINGPHQGGWVDTQTGEDWFIHFQDKAAYGRVVHLQPMKWLNDWPMIGKQIPGSQTGEPVLTFKKPNVGKTHPIETPVESDNFNGKTMGKQWQWQANPRATWSFLYPEKGVLRLYTQLVADSAQNLWDVPHVLLQKFPSEEFTATTKVTFHPNEKLEKEKTGLIVMGQSYANLALVSEKDGMYLVFGEAIDAHRGAPEQETVLSKLNTNTLYLRVTVSNGAKCLFSYSKDGKNFEPVYKVFQATPGQWIGAKVGLFSTRGTQINDSGWGDYDWFSIENK
ncbi:glycoside hydrolase 43 family protein [Olivibacter sp. SDN3]|uniref:glycoside hydrolase family 43 protein n=1 Tax=Olivibacter sp. SDN3 TaxID=2764720 RepID=UPI0016519456|nr:glycoside hydrolase 43 family protein [Olivibacter sp. SDN3]QNL49266.1 glycoside hydrolase 43 family protein [Olivibacter sp. SDN3]